MNSPVVSVIIPVYNAEQYLRKCLDSLTHQSLRNIEIICVDDGSRDGSAEILREYNSEDERVKIICQQNAGAGAARNNGIEQARGEWIAFVDADDITDPEMLEKASEHGEREKADLVLFGADIFSDGSDETQHMTWALAEKLLPIGDSSPAGEVEDRIFQLTSPAPWMRLYRRSFLNEFGLRFPSLPNSEDMPFSMSCMAVARRLCWLKRDFYHYRKGMTTNNQSGKAKNPKAFAQAVLLLKSYLEDQGLWEKLEVSFSRFACEQVRFNFSDLSYVSVPDEVRSEILTELGLTGIVDIRGKRVLIQGNPIVTVIIPVFNAKEYLREALDSLLAQTLREFEVFAVDDGSTDETPDILREYMDRDSRITVLHQKNAGAAAARNNGMTRAKGEYLYFMDADDLLKPTLLEEAYVSATRFHTDVTIFGSEILDQETGRIEKTSYVCKGFLFPGRTSATAEEFSRYMYQFTTPAPWNKLFRRDFVEQQGLRFQQLPNTNDFAFVYTAFGVAERFSWVDKPLYVYRRGYQFSTQDKKANAPKAFAEALLKTKGELISRGAYERVKASFEEEYENFTSWNLGGTAYQKVPVETRNEIIHMLGLDGRVDDKGGRVKEKMKLVPIESQTSSLCITKVENAVESPLVSLIIPCWNVVDYVAECLDSVLRQTMTEFEVLCVNDGSTDGTRDILRLYQQADARVKVIDQPNGGLCSARNTGMAQARGKYTLFLDSDDMLVPDTLAQICKPMEANRLDVCLFGGLCFYDSLKAEAQPQEDPAYYYSNYDNAGQLMSGACLFSDLVHKKKYCVSVYLQMFDTSFLREKKILFSEGYIYEDNAFTFNALLHAGRAMKVNRPLYLRRYREGSIIMGEIDCKNVNGYVRCMRDMLICVEDMHLYPRLSDSIRTVLRSAEKAAFNYYERLGEREKEKLKTSSSMDAIWFSVLAEKNVTKTTVVVSEADKIKSERINGSTGWRRKLHSNLYYLAENGVRAMTSKCVRGGFRRVKRMMKEAGKKLRLITDKDTA